MKGFAWIREHRRSAVGLVLFVAGGFVTAVINKIIENNDLEWLKAIWRGAWGFVVGAYDWLLSSAPIPVWLIVPVVALALVPVWQFIKSIHITRVAAQGLTLTEAESMVLAVIQAVDETDKYSVTLPVISEHTPLTRLQIEAALDALEGHGFIRCSYFITGPCEYSLKPEGRAYLLSLHQQRAAAHQQYTALPNCRT